MTGMMQALAVTIALQQAPAAGQDGLTLTRAIAIAREGEPALQSARAGVDVARGERTQAALRPNPDVTFEQREQAGGSDRETMIAFELPLDLFRRAPRIESAGRGVERSEADVRDRERLLAAAVRERYGDALIASRRVEVMDAVVAAAARTLELLSDRVTAGAAPPLERDVAAVDLHRLEGERALEQGRRAAALANLNVLLGRAASAPLVLADSLEQLASVSPSASNVATTERDDVRAAAADLEIARAQSRLARQGSKPELNVFGGYTRMDAGFPQSGFGGGGLEPIHGVFHNVTAGVRVTLPLFDRGQGMVAAARGRETVAAQALAARRLAVDAESTAAAARLAAARQALASYSGDTRTLARKNVDVVRETYTLGGATLFDVLNEQRRYLEFETAYTGALAEAYAAVTDLQRAKGEIQ